MKNIKTPATVLAVVALLGLLIFGLEKLASEDAVTQGTGTLATASDTKIKGNDNASLTLLEYSDFQCPACATYEPFITQLHHDFPDTLKIVYRYYPLTTIHKNALLSAKAAEAAKAQGKFWEMHDKLFTTQKDWEKLPDPKDIFRGYAEQLGLNTTQFISDINSKATNDAIESDQALGDYATIPGTPTFFLNGKKLENPKNYTAFKKVISDNLER
jgi:protein-disulfide isomerase